MHLTYVQCGSLRSVELRSAGACGGHLVHSPAPGIVNLQGSGLCCVLSLPYAECQDWTQNSSQEYFGCGLTSAEQRVTKR